MLTCPGVLALTCPGVLVFVKSHKSDQANINACIVDFLHEPYDSIRDPLDLLFNDLAKGAPIPPFSIGYSIGMTKGVAAIAITYAVVKLKLEHSEMQTIQAELVALLAMRATCDPAVDVEEQVNRSISRKIRASERPRPQVLQLHSAFERTLRSKKAKWGPPPGHSTSGSHHGDL